MKLPYNRIRPPTGGQARKPKCARKSSELGLGSQGAS